MRRLTPLLFTVAIVSCYGGSAADQPVHARDRIAARQAANLTKTALVLRTGAPLVVGAFSISGDGRDGEQGTIQPGVAVWNADTGAMLEDRQINVPPDGSFTTATANTEHDAPSLVRTANSAVLAIYGAVSTYGAYHPPPAWHCAAAVACEPFKYAAPQVATDAGIVEALAQSPQYLLPTVGLSEASSATLESTTIVAGQQQPDSRFGQPGAQGYVTLHAGPGGITFDTAAGPWNFERSPGPPADGEEVPALMPSDGAYADVGIVRAATGEGTFALQIGSASCAITIDAQGNAAQAAADIAAAFAARCPALRDRFAAMQVKDDRAMVVDGTALAPAVVGLTTTETGPLPNPHVACSGSIACASPRGADTMLVERGSGVHHHFLFGGVVRSGPYFYYLMDVEKSTGNWYARAGSSYGLSLVCLRASPPQGATWTWTNCAGQHPFHLAPGEHPVDRLTPRSGYLIGAPANGYRGNMAPYVDDWSMRAQAQSAGFPVIAAESLVRMRDGNLMIVHGCATTTHVTTACYALYDARTGATARAGTIDEPEGGGSLASIAVLQRTDGTIEAGVLAGEGERWGCGAAATCFLTYRYDTAQGRWVHLGSAPLGGTNTAGFPGSLDVSGDRFVIETHRRTASGYDVETTLRS